MLWYRLSLATAACYTCQSLETKGKINTRTHPNSLWTVAQLSAEYHPSSVRPPKLKLPLLTLPKRRVLQALPYHKARRHLPLVPVCLSLPPPSPATVRMTAEPCDSVVSSLDPLSSSNLHPSPWAIHPGMETLQGHVVPAPLPHILQMSGHADR